jgi:hypothetical protein
MNREFFEEKIERLERELNALKEKHGEDGYKYEGLRGAAKEMADELELFLDNESRTIYDLRTALALLKCAL